MIEDGVGFPGYKMASLSTTEGFQHSAEKEDRVPLCDNNASYFCNISCVETKQLLRKIPQAEYATQKRTRTKRARSMSFINVSPTAFPPYPFSFFLFFAAILDNLQTSERNRRENTSQCPSRFLSSVHLFSLSSLKIYP